MKILILIAFAFGLQACTSLSKSDCAQMDWSQKGFEDGKTGQPAGVISEHAETCGKHGFTADRALWNKNYIEGLKAFCTEPQGFLLGRQGRSNPGTCPAALQPDFVRGYQRGNSEYQAEESRRIEQEEIERKESSKRAAVASAYSRNECSWDSDCGGERTCRRDSQFVEGEFIDVGICQ